MSAAEAELGPRVVSPGLITETQLHPTQLQHQPTLADPSMVKLTRGTSCVLCQQRKVRCDKNKPCANCLKARVECRVVPPQPPRRRKKRPQPQDRALVTRLRKYEALLTENGIDFDAYGYELRSDAGPSAEGIDELETGLEALQTSPEPSISPTLSSQKLHKTGNSIFSLHKGFRASEQLLHDSSEDDDPEPTIHRAFTRMFSNTDGFPFVMSGRQHNIEHLHPPPIQTFQLWQIYIDRVNALLKITHVPSVQGLIVKTSSDLPNAPKDVEALMFGIYAMAVTSMEDDEVEAMLNMSKHDALTQFLHANQQALLNAGFMTNHNLYTLQAYVLYLLAVRWSVDPRQVFCLIGIAVRIAQRMGLHRDPSIFPIYPFEAEQRRRLWWTIVSYDRRIGEMTGSTVTSLSGGGDCRLPLNINDSDLHVNGAEPPSSHSGPTEMLFALTRLEIAMAVSNTSNRDAGTRVSLDKQSPLSSSSQSASKQHASPSSASTVRSVGQDATSLSLDDFCSYMESTYLDDCDPKIPLHFFTMTMTRQTLYKMRVIGHLIQLKATDSPIHETERGSVFALAVQMVEYDNIVHSSDSLKPYKWYTLHHFPFPAYVVLAQELRQRSFGPEVERAWEALSINHRMRGMHHPQQSPMSQGLGRQFIKAWDAHSDACVTNGREAPLPPDFICTLKGWAETIHQRKAKTQQTLPNDRGGPHSPGPSEAKTLMTPPSVGHMPVSSAASAINMGGPVIQDAGEMDWTHLMSNYGSGMMYTPAFEGFYGAFGPMTTQTPGTMGNRLGGPGGPGGIPPGGGPMF